MPLTQLRGWVQLTAKILHMSHSQLIWRTEHQTSSQTELLTTSIVILRREKQDQGFTNIHVFNLKVT